MIQPCHRYALRPGFIGPLTRRQTLRRAHNRVAAAKKREQRKAAGTYGKPRERYEDEAWWELRW